jgi:hypothetical protein
MMNRGNKKTIIKNINLSNIMEVDLRELVFSDTFECTLNQVLQRRDELKQDITQLYIVVDEENNVVVGELDVLALQSMEITYHKVIFKGSKDKRTFDFSEIGGDVLGKALHKPNSDLSEILGAKTKKDKKG